MMIGKSSSSCFKREIIKRIHEHLNRSMTRTSGVVSDGRHGFSQLLRSSSRCEVSEDGENGAVVEA
jgi:hypothetical protein